MEILSEKIGALGVITFNRPDKANALTGAMAKLLCDKLKIIAEDRAIRAVLLRGNGDHFMHGHDLQIYAADSNAIQDQIFQKVQFFYTAIREIAAMEKPVITAAHGKISGAGFNLMLASDLVIAAQNAAFNAGFVNHALVPDGGITFFLPRKIGAARASEVLLLSEDFSAENGEKWGLLNRVVAAASLQGEALAWGEKIAAGPTRIMGAAKRLLARSFEQDLNAHLSLESAFFNNGLKTLDFREGIKAYMAQRPAKYSGL